MTILVCLRATVLVCNTCGGTSRAEREPGDVEATSAVKHIERAASVGWRISDEKTDADQCPTCGDQRSSASPPRRSGVFRIVRPHTGNDTPTTPAAPSMSTRVRELITDDNADHDRSPA